MAGQRIIINGSPVYVDFADDHGSAIINGRLWQWEYNEYLGPGFLRKDGSYRKCQCPTVKAVWDAFEKWHKGYERRKKGKEGA